MGDKIWKMYFAVYDTNSPAEVTNGIKVKNPDNSTARLKISIQLDQGYWQMSIE